MKEYILFACWILMVGQLQGMIKEPNEPEGITIFFGEKSYPISYREAMQSVTLKNQYTGVKENFDRILHAPAYNPWVINKTLALLKELAQCPANLKGKALLDRLEKKIEIQESQTVNKWWNNQLYIETVDLLKAVDYLDIPPAITFLIYTLIKKIKKSENIEELITKEKVCTNFKYEFARYYRLLMGDFFPRVDRDTYSFSLQEYEDYQKHYLFSYIFKLKEYSRDFSGLQLGDLQGFEKLPNYNSASFILLENNHIISLANVFAGPNSVERLNVNNNRIQKIESSNFINLKNLTQLRLNNNKITHLEASVFEPLVNLSLLNLDNNNIADIDKTAFKGLCNLWDLFLDRNKIKDLQRGTFEANTNLRRLKLSNNDELNFDVPLVEKLIHLTSLCLGGNNINEEKQHEIISQLQVLNSHAIIDFI